MPGMSVARIGGMKRVKIVCAGIRRVTSTTFGSTRSIHGVGHGPSRPNMTCMSRQRWITRLEGIGRIAPPAPLRQ
jgi:hypothetical protein